MNTKLISLALAAMPMALAQPAFAGSAHAARSAAAERCTVATPQQVEGLFTSFNDAWQTKNPATVAALFDDDAVLLPTVSNTPRTDPAGVEDYFVKFLKSSPVSRIDTSTIKTGCNWAARLGTWTVTLTDPATGAKTDVKARYSFIYGFEDGMWRIEHLHSSVMPEKL